MDAKANKTVFEGLQIENLTFMNDKNHNFTCI